MVVGIQLSSRSLEELPAPATPDILFEVDTLTKAYCTDEAANVNRDKETQPVHGTLWTENWDN